MEVGRDLYLTHLVSSHGGNLSLRRFGGGALVTRTGAMLGHLTAADLVEVHSGGQRDDLEAPEPSSNTAVHLAIYAAVPEANAIIHAHSVHTTFASLDWEVIAAPTVEAELVVGRVPVISVDVGEEARPVAEAMRPSEEGAAAARIVAVRGHGTFAWGEDVWDALRVTSALEESAHVMYLRGGDA